MNSSTTLQNQATAGEQSTHRKPQPVLPKGHAHNDYLHERPLLDAIDHGFASVEADIFLDDGKLLIGHDRSQLRPQRTLESTYLHPIESKVRENDGFVVHPDEPFLLLVDIKTDALATYRILHDTLRQYKTMLTETTKGIVTQRAVTVIVSGNRPIDFIKSQSKRWASVDGRLPDLAGDSPSHLIPLISDHWGRHFVWRGRGVFPADQRKRLHNWVDQAHRQGRQVRFWATPESPIVWQELIEAKVDFINTDKLSELSNHLQQQKNAP